MNTNTTDRSLPLIGPNGERPAYSVQGESCAQCGAPAFHLEALPFCLEHSQGTLADSRERWYLTAEVEATRTGSEYLTERRTVSRTFPIGTPYCEIDDELREDWIALMDRSEYAYAFDAIEWDAPAQR